MAIHLVGQEQRLAQGDPARPRARATSAMIWAPLLPPPTTSTLCPANESGPT
jgi:hypothetical protein